MAGRIDVDDLKNMTYEQYLADFERQKKAIESPQ